MTGLLPNGWMDHRNGVRHDNRWANLRTCTPTQNASNRKPQANNKSGVVGVHWREKGQRWRVEIKYHGKQKTLAQVKTLECAQQLRFMAERMYFGEFARELTTPE